MSFDALGEVESAIDAFEKSKGSPERKESDSPQKKGPEKTEPSSLLTTGEHMKSNVRSISELDDLMSALDDLGVPEKSSAAPQEVLEASKAAALAPKLLSWSKKGQCVCASVGGGGNFVSMSLFAG